MSEIHIERYKTDRIKKETSLVPCVIDTEDIRCIFKDKYGTHIALYQGYMTKVPYDFDKLLAFLGL